MRTAIISIVAAFSLVTLLLVGLGHFVQATPVNADTECNTSGIPSVGTDKENYAPKETVTITGSGYECQVVLTVKVTRPDGSVVVGDGTFASGSDSVVTDNDGAVVNDGAFVYAYILDGIEGTYVVDVLHTDGTALASTTFTITVSPADELDVPPTPGLVQGTGNHFEITDSDYLNVVLDSSETIEVILTSVPRVVLIDVEAHASAGSTELSLGGLVPDTTYIMQNNGSPDTAEIISDADGNYAWTQDISQYHSIAIYAELGTLFIFSGDSNLACRNNGSWNQSTLTCTFNRDVAGPIFPLTSGMTLDGNGHKITAPNNFGIFVPIRRTGVTVKNFEISQVTYGVKTSSFAHNLTLIDNTINDATIAGVWVENSNNLTMTGNTSNGRSLGVFLSNTKDTTLSSNTIHGTSNQGLSARNTNNLTMTGNTVRGRFQNSFNNVNNSTFEDNTFSADFNYALLTFTTNNNRYAGNTFKALRLGVYVSRVFNFLHLLW